MEKDYRSLFLVKIFTQCENEQIMSLFLIKQNSISDKKSTIYLYFDTIHILINAQLSKKYMNNVISCLIHFISHTPPIVKFACDTFHT